MDVNIAHRLSESEWMDVNTAHRLSESEWMDVYAEHRLSEITLQRRLSNILGMKHAASVRFAVVFIVWNFADFIVENILLLRINNIFMFYTFFGCIEKLLKFYFTLFDSNGNHVSSAVFFH